MRSAQPGSGAPVPRSTEEPEPTVTCPALAAVASVRSTATANDAFLEVEIKPQQELSEQVMEDQFYDRILAILFDVEPQEVNKIPIKINHNYEKPNIATPPDATQWNIHMFLVENGFTTMEQVMEKFGMRDLMNNSPTLGSDPSPTIKTWKKQNHRTWDNTPKEGWDNQRKELKRNFHVHPKDSVREIMDKKKELLDSANESIKIKNEIERKKQAKKKKG